MPGTNLTRAEAEARAAAVSTETYAIELDLTTSEDTFRSTSTVTFAATAGAETFIDLIAPEVVSITLNGEHLDPATHFSDSRISLPNLREHNELTVVATCDYMNTGEGLHRFVDPEDGEVYLYSQFEVADTRRVYAVFEQPDLKASFQFTVPHPTTGTSSPTALAPRPRSRAASPSRTSRAASRASSSPPPSASPAT